MGNDSKWKDLIVSSKFRYSFILTRNKKYGFYLIVIRVRKRFGSEYISLPIRLIPLLKHFLDNVGDYLEEHYYGWSEKDGI
jgi:hypothetical protein